MTSIGRYAVLGTLNEVIDYVEPTAKPSMTLSSQCHGRDKRLLAIVNRLREARSQRLSCIGLGRFSSRFSVAPWPFRGHANFRGQGQPLLRLDCHHQRGEDYIFGSLAALVLLPLMLLIALAIKLDSKGPVMFRQKRLGFLNQEFEIYNLPVLVGPAESRCQVSVAGS